MAAEDNNLATFAKFARSDSVVVTAAVGALNTDAPTNTVLLFKTSTKGSIVTRLTAAPRATLATPASLLVFTSKDAGTTKMLKDSETMPSQTLTVGVRIDETVFGNATEARPWRLGPNVEVYVGSQVAGNIVYSYEVSDFGPM